jgi:adenine-specific DNA-methyltransferase
MREIKREKVMAKLKDTPKFDRPREKFLEKGADALSDSELLAILLGSGIKGTNVKVLAQKILKKFGDKFLNVTVDELTQISGIGPAKALQIVSVLALAGRLYDKQNAPDNLILSAENAIAQVSELKEKKQEHLVCLYLNARNALIKKETVSIGSLDKSIADPREVFAPALMMHAAGVILAHNHPSGDPKPSESDKQVAKRMLEAGKTMGVNVIDFLIVAKNGTHSALGELHDTELTDTEYVAEGAQASLFDLLGIERPLYQINIQKVKKHYFQAIQSKTGYFQLQNRRYLGNKHKLLGFIEDIILEKCGKIDSLCDIFAGTGVVGERFNNFDVKIYSNDFLSSNHVCLKTFFGVSTDIQGEIARKISYLNNLPYTEDNYFSKNFGGTYFSIENAKKIGKIREEIDNISENEEEKSVLVCSLLYAVDKVANTVGHYDAFRKELDTIQPVRLLVPDFDYSRNADNEVYREDANSLIRKISCDVLYIDPPYNSRQYSDAYHLLENLAEWKKPEVVGVAKKMDRSHIKSSYCLKNATQSFEDLISNAKCNHILLSYNNTGDSKDGRSNARMEDKDILKILNKKGAVEVFEKDYKAFTTGRSNGDANAERIFYCKVNK